MDCLNFILYPAKGYPPSCHTQEALEYGCQFNAHQVGWLKKKTSNETKTNTCEVLIHVHVLVTSMVIKTTEFTYCYCCSSRYTTVMLNWHIEIYLQSTLDWFLLFRLKSPVRFVAIGPMANIHCYTVYTLFVIKTCMIMGKISISINCSLLTLPPPPPPPI